jgi:hypothetical protein
LLEESLVLGREAGDKVMIAEALMQLAGTTDGLGDPARAKEILEEGIAMCREVGYTYRLPDFLLSLGYHLMVEGHYERGAALNEEAVAICRERGYKKSLNLALDNLGWVALLQGDHERARTFYEESLMVCKEMGDKMIASESLDGLACVAGAQGEAEPGGQALRGVRSIARGAARSGSLPTYARGGGLARAVPGQRPLGARGGSASTGAGYGAGGSHRVRPLCRGALGHVPFLHHGPVIALLNAQPPGRPYIQGGRSAGAGGLGDDQR